VAEAGGPSTQEGIFYQNSVAARCLADLLDLDNLLPRERVLEVRVEAPAHVDDIVVRYADGHRDWLQAKVSLRSAGDAWRGLWQSFAAQKASQEFGQEDRLVLVLGERSPLAAALRQLCERAISSVDEGELRSRLTKEPERLLVSIDAVIGDIGNTIEVLRRTSVEVAPLDELEDAFARRRLGAAFALPSRLFSTLRGMAGGGARNRMLFLAAPLRQRLSRDFDIDMAEPTEWGLPAYRRTVERLAIIEIPGTGISAPVDDLFVWPTAYRFERGSTRDFDDEIPRWDIERSTDRIDMRLFPEERLDRCIVVAGPGYGKSALLQAIQARLVRTPIVPVLVPLGSFGTSDLGVLEYLTTEVNRAFDVRVDWHRLAEQGLVVLLFDGLDEIPNDQRKSVLNRIAMLSARHPLTPWILTVRDPAVLSGPADAEILELLPLENSDISRFAKAMKASLPGLDEWEFTKSLGAYPDLARLARIPLFLSMLLAGWKRSRPLPQSRSDLIEAYLRTLFVPADHKVVQATNMDSELLREVAEELAFDSIERQEIGATERQAREVATRLSSMSAEAVLERLLICGVLRRQSSVRLQFPYPIVQEYLAACHLVRTDPAAVAGRIGEAIKRPWAQVIQFAIELLPEASQIIKQMLASEDDAFSTGLRLVGRCVVNGAKVSEDVHAEVGHQLANLWVRASWRIRERVGRLIVDGFSNPLHPAVRQRLGCRWLIGSGAGEIVSAAMDRELTREVVQSLLNGNLERFMSLRDIKQPIADLGDEVLTLVANRARQEDTTEEELNALTEFVEVLDYHKISLGAALNLALNDSMPDSLRLTAFSVAPDPIDSRAWLLLERALASDDYMDRFAARRVITRSDNPGGTLLGLLRREAVPYKCRVELASTLPFILPDQEIRHQFIKAAAHDTELSSHLRDIMRVYLSKYGDRVIFEDLLNRLSSVEEDVAAATLASLNYWPERQLGLRAAHAADRRVESGADPSMLAQNAWTGLRYKFDQDGFSGGILEEVPLHPASSDWAEIIEGWTKRRELSLIQRLRILLVALKLGLPMALDEVERIVSSIDDPDASDYDEDPYGHTLREAIDELRRRKRVISLELAERFARAKRPNLYFAGIGAIAARADQVCLDTLLELNNDPDQRARLDEIADAIERVAGRLGVTIYGTGGSLRRSS